jgi:hypothetical protein
MFILQWKSKLRNAWEQKIRVSTLGRCLRLLHTGSAGACGRPAWRQSVLYMFPGAYLQVHHALVWLNQTDIKLTKLKMSDAILTGSMTQSLT